MSGLTWNKQTKTWLIDGQPSARRKGQRGFDPIRRKRGVSKPMSERAIMRELKRDEGNYWRQQFTAQGLSSSGVELRVLLYTNEHFSLRYLKNYLKDAVARGKCPTSFGGSHSWKYGNGRCNRCGALDSASHRRLLRALPPKTTKLLGISKPELRKLVKENPEQVVRMISRAKRRKDRNAAVLARARELGFTPPSERVNQ
jgi:hypothetical protein